MTTFAQIFFTKDDGGSMDTMISGAIDADHIIAFLNSTAHLRTSDVDRMLFSVDGYMQYQRDERFVRKQAIYVEKSVKYKKVFDPPSALPGYACNTVGRVLVLDRYREVSQGGFRWVTIPGPVEDIREHGDSIVNEFGKLFSCWSLTCGKVEILPTRQTILHAPRVPKRKHSL